MSKFKTVSICAPAFNEEQGIIPVIESWVSSLDQAVEDNLISDYEIVICDDGSSDGTVRSLTSLNNPKLVVIQNLSNQGPGIAIRRAIAASQNDWVITIDSDGQFNLDEALQWLSIAQIERAVLGYRLKADKTLLKIGSKVSTWLLSSTVNTQIHDANCMMKLIPGAVARSLDLRAVGLNYSGEMTYLLINSNLKIDWAKVSHKKRVSGKSSAKLFRDGKKRLLFQFYLILEYKLMKSNVLSRRASQ